MAKSRGYHNLAANETSLTKREAERGQTKIRICVANEQLIVFVARIITEPGAKRLHAREKNTRRIKRLLSDVQSLRSRFRIRGVS
jgi:hypothetical protein